MYRECFRRIDSDREFWPVRGQLTDTDKFKNVDTKVNH